MANQLAENPWVIDTPSAALIYSTGIWVERMEFVGYNADTDTVVVQNKNGQIVWQGNGANDQRTVAGGQGYFNGLKVVTLDSGKLLIYVK